MCLFNRGKTSSLLPISRLLWYAPAAGSLPIWVSPSKTPVRSELAGNNRKAKAQARTAQATADVSVLLLLWVVAVCMGL